MYTTQRNNFRKTFLRVYFFLIAKGIVSSTPMV